MNFYDIKPDKKRDESVQDFSYEQLIDGEYVKVQHLYYSESGDHFWKGRRWSKAEWDAWVNDPEGYK